MLSHTGKAQTFCGKSDNRRCFSVLKISLGLGSPPFGFRKSMTTQLFTEKRFFSGKQCKIVAFNGNGRNKNEKKVRKRSNFTLQNTAFHGTDVMKVENSRKSAQKVFSEKMRKEKVWKVEFFTRHGKAHPNYHTRTQDPSFCLGWQPSRIFTSH